MSSCDRAYGISSVECSGHGICISGRCFCNSGWTGLADYEEDAYFDCDINTTVLIAVSYMNLIVATIAIVATIRNLCIYKHSVHELKTGIISGFLFQSIGVLLGSIGKIIDPTKFVIGPYEGILPAIGYGMSWFFQMLGWVCFSLSLCNFLEGYSKVCSVESREKIKVRVQYLRKIAPYVGIPPVIGCFFQLLVVCIPHQTDNIAIAVNFMLFITFVMEGVFVIYSLSIFTTEFGAYIKSQSDPAADIKKIHNTLLLLYRMIVVFCVCFGAFLICFSFWGYLRRKTTYLLVTMFFFMESLSLVVVLTQKGAKQTSSSTYYRTKIIVPSNEV